MGIVEEMMGNKEVAGEFFKMAGIADKQKSRVKRKIFESRKAAPKFRLPKSADGNGTKSFVKAENTKRCAAHKPNDIWSSKKEAS